MVLESSAANPKAVLQQAASEVPVWVIASTKTAKTDAWILRACLKELKGLLVFMMFSWLIMGFLGS